MRHFLLHEDRQDLCAHMWYAHCASFGFTTRPPPRTLWDLLCRDVIAYFCPSTKTAKRETGETFPVPAACWHLVPSQIFTLRCCRGQGRLKSRPTGIWRCFLDWVTSSKLFQASPRFTAMAKAKARKYLTWSSFQIVAMSLSISSSDRSLLLAPRILKQEF